LQHYSFAYGFNGLGIITVCIGSIFVFKEKLNLQKVFGLIFGVLGLFLINI
jgi:multidrug transporter EmrE-like cation transporter